MNLQLVIHESVGFTNLQSFFSGLQQNFILWVVWRIFFEFNGSSLPIRVVPFHPFRYFLVWINTFSVIVFWDDRVFLGPFQLI